jgi:hypothetical protein
MILQRDDNIVPATARIWGADVMELHLCVILVTLGVAIL